jgi:hypothetical protein
MKKVCKIKTRLQGLGFKGLVLTLRGFIGQNKEKI